MASVIIAGVGSYAPPKVLTNHDLSKIVDTSDEWIFTRSGIRERRIAGDDEACSDLAVKAANAALADAKIKASDIDLLIVATASPDTPLPSTGIVMAIGDGVPADHLIQPGRMVMFSKHSGTDFVFRDDKSAHDQTKKWRILDLAEIMCTLRSTDDSPLTSKVVPVKDIDSPDVPVLPGRALVG